MLKPTYHIDYPNRKTISDQNLIERLQQQDRSAFRELVAQHKDSVYNTCFGFLRNMQDAQDVSQEVFIQIHDSIGEFRQDAALSTWIYRIAVTKSLELIRYRKRKKRAGFFQALSSFFDEKEVSSEPEVDMHPGIQLENKERAEVLFQAIAKLPERQRVAFTLQKVEHLSYQEVSEVMELSIASVEALLHRAKANLRKQLYSYYQQNELD